MVEQWKQEEPALSLMPCFLEYAEPSIEAALLSCLEKKAKQVVVIPSLLFAAKHAKQDIPAILSQFKQKHPSLEILHTDVLGLHPLVLDVMQQRIIECLKREEAAWKPEETLIIAVGRGTSDVQANAEVTRAAHLLQARLHFQESMVAFASTVEPGLKSTLELAVKKPISTIVIVPLVLTDGKMFGDVKELAERFEAEFKTGKLLCAQPIGVHPNLVKLWQWRLQEALLPSDSGK